MGCHICLVPSQHMSYINSYLFIYCLHRVYVAARRLSLVAVSRGLLFIAVHGFLIAVASLVAGHGV